MSMECLLNPNFPFSRFLWCKINRICFRCLTSLENTLQLRYKTPFTRRAAGSSGMGGRCPTGAPRTRIRTLPSLFVEALITRERRDHGSYIAWCRQNGGGSPRTCSCRSGPTPPTITCGSLRGVGYSALV